MTRPPIRLDTDDLYWPSAEEWARWTLRGAALMGLLAISWGLGAASMARVALDARQAVLDAQASVGACVAMVDEATRLTLDATHMARIYGREPVPTWRTLETVANGPYVARATLP